MANLSQSPNFRETRQNDSVLVTPEQVGPNNPEQEHVEYKILEFPGQHIEQEVAGQNVGSEVTDGSVVNFPEKRQPLTEKSRRLREIEDIMSKKLEKVYISLSPEKKRKMEISGVDAAKEIEKLIEEFLKSGKDPSEKILEIVKAWTIKWMSEIQGFSEKYKKNIGLRSFLEQGLMIKVNNIMKLRNDAEELEQPQYQPAA